VHQSEPTVYTVNLVKYSEYRVPVHPQLTTGYQDSDGLLPWEFRVVHCATLAVVGFVSDRTAVL
jgi:hypothetical protein